MTKHFLYLVVLLFLVVDVRAHVGANRVSSIAGDDDDDDDIETTSSVNKKNNQERPNILFLLTDDQDLLLGSFDHMPHVQRLLQEQGTTFADGAVVHTPICCPSRSSILTGRYLHNLNVTNNHVQGNCNGQQWIDNIEDQGHTFAAQAQAEGYTTAYAGKYLNQYGHNNNKNDTTTLHVPHGFDHWLGLVGNSRYYNYDLIQRHGRNGTARRRHYGRHYPQDYLPNVISDQVLEWITTLSPPWLVVAAWPTPHGPFTAAPWANGTMRNHSSPGNTWPSFNATEASQQEKHWFLRQLHPLSHDTAAVVERFYQQRLEALQSIDRHVAQMIQALEQQQPTQPQQEEIQQETKRETPRRENQQENESTTTKTTPSLLDKTVIFYTSDNGYQFGQHRLSMDKRHLYEHDLRVPLVVRGPGIAANRTVTGRMVANIDFAPTILDIVRGDKKQMKNDIQDNNMDGLSFWKFLQRQNNDDDDENNTNDDPFLQRRDLLISYHGEGNGPCGLPQCPFNWDEPMHMPDARNNTYHCVRTLHRRQNSDHHPDTGENSIYCKFVDGQDFVEYYDLQTNPYQLNNDVGTLSTAQRQRYEKRLQELRRCQGASCSDSSYPTIVPPRPKTSS